jgi:hypothetical protein
MIRCACLAAAVDVPPDAEGALFILDGEAVGAFLDTAVAVVLPAGDEARAIALLNAGTRQLLVGEAALRDAGLVPRLVAQFGPGRVGVFVPARRMKVSWSFDAVSNADFRVVTPSLGEPAWEILRADGSATGIRVDWWLGEMKKRGASTMLVQVDIGDDTDLNLCAGLVEALGDLLWLAPRGATEPRLADWETYGKAARIALPPGLFARRAELLAAPSLAHGASPVAGEAGP